MDVSDIMGGKDGTMEAVKDVVGRRSGARYTHGTPARTLFLAALEDLRSKGRDNELCRIDGIDAVYTTLVDAWASEFGWDAEVTATIISAAKSGVARGAERNQEAGA